MFMQGKYHVQNFIQFMTIIDSLKVLSIINEKNVHIVVFSLLVEFLGLELGHSTLESLPKIIMANHLPFKIVKFFVSQKFP